MHVQPTNMTNKAIDPIALNLCTMLLKVEESVNLLAPATENSPDGKNVTTLILKALLTQTHTDFNQPLLFSS